MLIEALKGHWVELSGEAQTYSNQTHSLLHLNLGQIGPKKKSWTKKKLLLTKNKRILKQF